MEMGYIKNTIKLVVSDYWQYFMEGKLTMGIERQFRDNLRIIYYMLKETDFNVREIVDFVTEITGGDELDDKILAQRHAIIVDLVPGFMKYTFLNGKEPIVPNKNNNT